MVGSPQMIQCIVSTVSGVESSSVMISWMGPGGDTITSDSRVIISQTTSSGNIYTSVLQVVYLMEGDEGNYTCSVMILETIGSASGVLESLIGKLSLRTNPYQQIDIIHDYMSSLYFDIYAWQPILSYV